MPEKSKIESSKDAADVTALLIRAMEMADDFSDVIVLYKKKDSAGGCSGYMTASDMTVAVLNWHIDMLKYDILGIQGPSHADDTEYP